jgi:hypothetical protein
MGEKKQKKPTQCQKILDYIHRYGSITSWQAYADLGITQLAARIFNLKERGYEFETERVNTKNRMGEATHYDIYRLKEKTV